MHRFALALPALFAFALPLIAADWNQFRGPTQAGHAPESKLPTEWDTKKNVTWRKELPGEGWSSPVVSGGRIYLTAAVPGARRGDYSLRALGLDSATGEIVWDQEVFREDGTKSPRIHAKNSHASESASPNTV